MGSIEENTDQDQVRSCSHATLTLSRHARFAPRSVTSHGLACNNK